MPSWRSALPLLLLLAVALLSASGASSAQQRGDTTLSAVYLIGTAPPVLDLAQVRGAGVRIVSSVAALEAAATTADAIILDRESAPLARSAWLNEQYRQRRVIVGINIPMLELARLTGNREQSGLGGFLQDYGGRPFYSYFYARPPRNGVTHGGAGPDSLYSTTVLLGILRHKTIEPPIEPPPTGPHPTRPRPTPTRSPV